MAINTMDTNYNPVNRIVAQVLGAILVLVGLIGFVNDPVFGLFEVDVLHNIIHLLSGAALLVAGFVNNGIYARAANLTLGIVYALVTLLGFVAPAVLGAIFETNMADNWLHLLLAVVLIGVAFVNRAEVRRPVTGTRI